MPRSQGKVEAESRQMWSKYYAAYQLKEMLTMSAGRIFSKCFW